MDKVCLRAASPIFGKETEIEPKDLHSVYYRCDVIDPAPYRVIGVARISTEPSQ